MTNWSQDRMRACDIDCGWKNDKTSGFCVTFMEVRLFAEQILKFQTLLVRGYMVHTGCPRKNYPSEISR